MNLVVETKIGQELFLLKQVNILMTTFYIHILEFIILHFCFIFIKGIRVVVLYW